MEKTSSCQADFYRDDQEATELQWNFSVRLIVLTVDLNADYPFIPSFAFALSPFFPSFLPQ